MQEDQPCVFTRTYCLTMLLLKMCEIQGFLSVNLWGQMATSRGQILVSMAMTLCVFCVVLCVCCVCCWSVMCECVLVLVCHADLHLHPLHSTPLTLCTFKTAPVCNFETSPVCAHTGTYLKHGGFQRATPHHTTRTHDNLLAQGRCESAVC